MGCNGYAQSSCRLHPAMPAMLGMLLRHIFWMPGSPAGFNGETCQTHGRWWTWINQIGIQEWGRPLWWIIFNHIPHWTYHKLGYAFVAEAYNRRRQERARQEQERHNDRKDEGNNEFDAQGSKHDNHSKQSDIMFLWHQDNIWASKLTYRLNFLKHGTSERQGCTARCLAIEETCWHTQISDSKRIHTSHDPPREGHEGWM